MARKAGTKTLPETYFTLVRQFPLTHIRNDDHLDAAQTMIDQLLKEELDEGAEADVLRELMASNRLSQTKLAKAVGISQSTISAVLNGTRSLTKEQVVKLGEFFHVSPAAFLPG